MNQAPLKSTTGIFTIDWSLERERVWNSSGMLPAHLLRRAMEEAASYQDAYAMLCATPLCAPAIFSIVGTNTGEHAIIERTRDGYYEVPLAVAANHFVLHTDGHHRGDQSPQRARILARTVCEPRDMDFSWLQPPILNAQTVVAFIANPRDGAISVCGDDAEERVTEPLSPSG